MKLLDIVLLLKNEEYITIKYLDIDYAIQKKISDVTEYDLLNYMVVEIIQDYGGTPCYVIESIWEYN